MKQECNNQTSLPLTLEGAFNVRDLGVYTNTKNVQLKEHQLLRADGSKLSEKDCKTLLEYGLEAVIDLRSDVEKEREASVWEKSNLVDYYHVSLLDQSNSSMMKGTFPKSMAELYQGLLENNKEEFKTILKIISQYKDGCVLFHCTAGKDRTGVLAMLLLGLVEVEERVIVEDYAVTEKYMEPVFKRQKEQLKQMGIEIPAYVLESKAKDMEQTIQFLNQRYGGIVPYLNTMEIPETLTVIKNKMIG